MLQLAHMKCTNKELAEDLVQEACIKAYSSYLNKKEGEIKNPKAWLFKILINTHIDYTRKKSLAIVDIDSLDLIDNKSPASDTETNIFFKDLSEAINRLETEQRIIIYLSDINEYPYKEISKILNIPLGTVMSRLHRARQALRKLLSQKGYLKEKELATIRN